MSDQAMIQAQSTTQRRETAADSGARTSRQCSRRRSGFTIIEILVAVAIVIILVSILVVAVNVAIRGSQRSNTQALMNSIASGLAQFQDDMGYLPPVLRQNRDVRWMFDTSPSPRFNGPDPTIVGIDYRDEIQDWFSITALAEYLLGYGTADEDGYDGLGLRHPGPDGFWGVTSPHLGLSNQPGTIDARREFLNPDGPHAQVSASYRKGRVFGPYLQLRDDRLLGAVSPGASPDPMTGQFQITFPGEAGFNPDHPRVIVDYWGQPLRYYRLPHPPGAINRRYQRQPGFPPGGPNHLQDLPSLSHVIALRPFVIPPGEDTDVQSIFADDAGDTSTTHRLQNASFAILSAGPDRSLNPMFRVDEQEFNRDNMVEVGR